ncbi:MAG: hypothetical protein GX096_11190 [Clostridiales bacterium]|nr:hypothetical protein [Clostridiales bacterium]
MKKFVSFLAVTLLFLASTALGEETIPARYVSLLQSWNAATGEELHLNILEYWTASDTDSSGHFTPDHMPLNIRFGGSTNELIADKENWDLAIVSSKEVDLQALADEQIICHDEYNPQDPFALHQWLLSEDMQALLPKDLLMIYYVYVYDYDAQTDDATFLICQDDKNSQKDYSRNPENFAAEIMRMRSADAARSLEGMNQANAWTEEKLLAADSVNATGGMRPIDAWTVDKLIANAEDWDAAIIMTDRGETLETLDAAGLLFDFSTNPYFPSRTSIRPYESDCGNNYCELANGIFSADGRMIGIPCVECIQEDADTEGMLIINAKSPYLERAQAYAVHLMESKDLIWTAEN